MTVLCVLTSCMHAQVPQGDEEQSEHFTSRSLSEISFVSEKSTASLASHASIGTSHASSPAGTADGVDPAMLKYMQLLNENRSAAKAPEQEVKVQFIGQYFIQLEIQLEMLL